MFTVKKMLLSEKTVTSLKKIQFLSLKREVRRNKSESIDKGNTHHREDLLD